MGSAALPFPAMSCSQCPHCQALAAKAALHIDRRLRAGNQQVDLGFYREFGAAYDLAVARHRQPMRALREANPDLSIHQCRAYLKRARQLDMVRTPRATGAPVARPAPEPSSPAPAAALSVQLDGVPDWLIGAAALHTVVDTWALVRLGRYPDETAAREDIDRLVAAGMAEWRGDRKVAASPVFFTAVDA